MKHFFKKGQQLSAKERKDTIPKTDGVNSTVEEEELNKIIGYSEYDIGDDESYSKNRLYLCEDKLILAKNTSKDSDNCIYFKGIPEKYIKASFVKESYDICEIPLEEGDNLRIVRNISGGTLCITKDTPSFSPKIQEENNPEEQNTQKNLGGDRIVCRFSAALTANMQKICSLRRNPDMEKQKEQAENNEEFCPKCGSRYSDRQRKICHKCFDKGSIFVRTIAYFKPYSFRAAIMILVCLAATGANLLWPYLNGVVLYDYVLGKNNDFLARIGLPQGNFVLALGLMVLTTALLKAASLAFQMIRDVISVNIVPNVVKDLKCDIFDNMERLSLRFFSSKETGSLMTRVESDAGRVTNFFSEGLPGIFTTVLSLVATATVMFSVNIPLTCFSLAILPLLFLISLKLFPKLWHLFGKRHRAERSMNSKINDNLRGSRVVKAFGKEKEENERFESYNARVKECEINIVSFNNKIYALYNTVENLLSLIIWGVGAYFVIGGINEFTFGTLIMFTGYVSQLSGPINFMSRCMHWATDTMNCAQRMYEIIDAVPDVTEKENAVNLEKPQGQIEIKNMTFGYDSHRPVLKNISLSVKSGETLGIVGRSGAGKSTLVALISRLYDPDEGSIEIDGINIKEMTFASLRKSVAMVSQETYIFVGTIMDNIRYAKPEASEWEVIRAALLAGAHDFICKMTDGYDTLIGSSGRALSGGERQRISMARAILQNPKILILDEATASVDTETERLIQNSLNYLVKGRTTISIAHRLSTLKNADRLVVIENGEISEQGTHSELLQKKGIYYKLHELQTKALALKASLE